MRYLYKMVIDPLSPNLASVRDYIKSQRLHGHNGYYCNQLKENWRGRLSVKLAGGKVIIKCHNIITLLVIPQPQQTTYM